jgi:multidrug resistance efflux pump
MPALTNGAPRGPSIAVVASPVFREQAVRAYMRGELSGTVLRVASPSASALIGAVASFVLVSVMIVSFAHVELTARGPGILEADTPPQSVVSPMQGVATRVAVRAGDSVVAGQVVVELDSSPWRANLLDAENHLAAVQSVERTLAKRQAALTEGRVALLHRVVGAVDRELEVQGEAVHQRAQKMAVLNDLRRDGLATERERIDVAGEWSDARRGELGLERSRVGTLAEIAQLEAELAQQRLRVDLDEVEARGKRDSAAVALEQTRVGAPCDGYVDSVTVHSGGVVVAGAPLLRVVPGPVPTRIVALLPERDRAFLEIGATARVELEQLPPSEFGTFQAKVVRIATDLASPLEIHEVVRDSAAQVEPAYRVELSISDDERTQRLAKYLRTSAFARVRFRLRSRRILGILIDPVRRWIN